MRTTRHIPFGPSTFPPVVLSWTLGMALLFAAVASISSAQDAAQPTASPAAPASETTAPAQPASTTDDDDDIGPDSDPQAAAAGYAARAAAQARLDALPAEIADEALRARVAEQWKEALTQWQAANQAAEQFIRRRKTIDGSAARLQSIQGEIEALRTKAAAAPEADASHSLVDLETELRELDLNLPEWNKLLGQRIARIDSQGQRLSESRQAAEEAQARLAEKVPPIPDNLPHELRAAIREARTAHRRADHEIVSNSDYFRNIQEPLAQLDAAERDLLSRRIEYVKTRREQLSTHIADKRRAEAEALRRESEIAARRSLEALPPSFREIAEENRELSSTLDQVLEKEKERAKFLQVTNEYVHSLQSDYDRIRERLESGDAGQTLGSYLWAKRRGLQREVY